MRNILSLVAQAALSVVVMVNGQQVPFDQPPVEQGGRVFVPLRGVFERLGASVVYSNGQINATGNGRNISLQIGSTQATVNGQPQTLDVAPFLVGSRTLVPLRFIAQALGANVDWNNDTSTVAITGSGSGIGRDSYIPPQQNGSFFLNNQQPTGVVNNLRPAIHASYSEPVQRGSVSVMIDGRDVTGAIQATPNGFDLVPAFSLGGGTHRVQVSGTTRAGVAFHTGWRFTINPQY